MNQTESKNRTSSLDHKRTIKVDNVISGIKRFGWLCVVFALLFGGVAYVYERVNYVPLYTAETTFTVSTENSSSSIGGVSVYSFYYDAATAGQLSETFPHLLSSGLIQNAICEDLEMSYLPVTFNAVAVEGSNMFTLKATSRYPEIAYKVLVSAIDNYPTIAKYAVGNIKIDMITSPVVPTTPSNTNDYISEVLKAMLIGFALGGMIIVLYAYTHNTVRTKNDLKSNLNNCEVLGVVPRVGFKKHTKDIDRSILTTNEKIDEGFTSSIRVLKNVIKNSLKHNEKIIIGTSTAPGEGKTTVTTNLAISMAEHGRKVLLVDGDVRRPSIVPLLGINPEEIEYIYATDDYKIAYLKDLRIHLMLFNTPEKGGFRYVNSSFIKDVFDSVRDKYDLILVDTPPCGLVSDALFFAQVADAAYYVVLQDAVRISKIKNGFNNLYSTDIKILGCILNGATSVHSSYGYGKYGYGKYGYGYNRYGYGYGYGKRGYGKYGYGYGYGEKKNKDKGKQE